MPSVVVKVLFFASLLMIKLIWIVFLYILKYCIRNHVTTEEKINFIVGSIEIFNIAKLKQWNKWSSMHYDPLHIIVILSYHFFFCLCFLRRHCQIWSDELLYLKTIGCFFYFLFTLESFFSTYFCHFFYLNKSVWFCEVIYIYPLYTWKKIIY